MRQAALRRRQHYPTRRRPSADEERACARYELHGGLSDFVDAAYAALEARGVFKVVLPPERFVEFSGLVSARGMGLERLRFVHDRDGVPAYLFEAWCRKGGRAELEVSPPLVVRGADGRYCEEVARRVAGAAVREPSRALVERVKEVVR